MEINKSKKFVIFGVIVFILAVLVAVGPILVTKYMRNKWQNTPKYKTSYILINVSGTLKMSARNELYLAGDNNKFYIIENMSEEDINNNIDKRVTITGKIKTPEGDVTVDGNPVRLYVSVEKIENENTLTEEEKTDDNSDSIARAEQEKIIKKNQIRIMVNAALNKSILFDVTRGTLTLEDRKTLKGDTKTVPILNDEFGDKVMLVGKDKIKKFANQKIVCLGRELPSVEGMPAVVDETIFEIYEIYDADYKKLL